MKQESYVKLSREGFRSICGESEGKYVNWISDINGELPIYITNTGYASILPITLPEKMKTTCLNPEYSNKIALQIERGEDHWIRWTFFQYYCDLLTFANSLIFHGIEERSVINVIGFNSPEWVISYFGSIFTNCISCGVYDTNTPSTCFYIAEHSEASMIIGENLVQVRKYLPYLGRLPKLKVIVIYLEDVSLGERIKILSEYENPNQITLYTWEEFMSAGRGSVIIDKGRPRGSKELEQRDKQMRPGHICALSYTSGTTGMPKGVMLTHDNLMYNITCVWNTYAGKPFAYGTKQPYSVVSYLSNSHIAPLNLDALSNFILIGTLTFARPDALRGSLITTLKKARPYMFLAVPRVWEKMEMSLKKKIGEKPLVLQRMLKQMRKIVSKGNMAYLNGKKYPFGYTMAAFLINRFKKALGLDRCHLFISGGAPLTKGTQNFFLGLNMPICVYYGMTEAASEVAGDMPIPGYFRLNSSGKLLGGMEYKIVNKREGQVGEICIRARNVFAGYYKNEKATKKTIDSEGYLHTGDLGYIDQDNFLFVTGRIKEIIITAGGENVAPGLLESTIKILCPLISQAVLIGDGRKYLSFLFTLKIENQEAAFQLADSAPLSSTIYDILNQINSQARTIREAILCPHIRKYIQNCIMLFNKKSISRAAQVKKWVIVPSEFSIFGGELTPSQKTRIKFIIKKYAGIIESMYPKETERELVAKL